MPECGEHVAIEVAQVPIPGRRSEVNGGGLPQLGPLGKLELPAGWVDPAARPDLCVLGVEPGVGVFFGGEMVIGDDPLPFVPVGGFPVVSVTLRDTLADG